MKKDFSKNVDVEFKNEVDKEVNRLKEKGVAIPNKDELSCLSKYIHNVFCKRYNLKGWKIIIKSLGINIYGSCYYGINTIILNSTFIGYVYLNEWVEIILHEFAHAKIGGGHNKKWREFFIKIGGIGETYHYRTSLESPLYKYKLICPECGRVSYMHKRRNDRSCGKCSGSKYNPNYKMVWTINEDYNTRLSA
jgi:ribosomal protein S27AE